MGAGRVALYKALIRRARKKVSVKQHYEPHLARFATIRFSNRKDGIVVRFLESFALRTQAEARFNHLAKANSTGLLVLVGVDGQILGSRGNQSLVEKWRSQTKAHPLLSSTVAEGKYRSQWPSEYPIGRR